MVSLRTLIGRSILALAVVLAIAGITQRAEPLLAQGTPGTPVCNQYGLPACPSGYNVACADQSQYPGCNGSTPVCQTCSNTGNCTPTGASPICCAALLCPFLGGPGWTCTNQYDANGCRLCPLCMPPAGSSAAAKDAATGGGAPGGTGPGATAGPGGTGPGATAGPGGTGPGGTGPGGAGPGGAGPGGTVSGGGPSVCYATACGDGIRAGAEQCDDGNTTNGDDCSSTCQNESEIRWCCDTGENPPFCKAVTEALPAGCAGGSMYQDQAACTAVCGGGPTCGNGNLDTGEECDDGNTTSGDGCSSTCQTEDDGGYCCNRSGTRIGQQCTAGSQDSCTEWYPDYSMCTAQCIIDEPPVDCPGADLASISDDGRSVAFATDYHGVDLGSGWGIYVRDRSAHTTQFIAKGWYPTISGDGTVVMYERSSGPGEFASTHPVKRTIVHHLIETGVEKEVTLDGAQLAYNNDTLNTWRLFPSADGRYVFLQVQRPGSEYVAYVVYDWQQNAIYRPAGSQINAASVHLWRNFTIRLQPTNTTFTLQIGSDWPERFSTIDGTWTVRSLTGGETQTGELKNNTTGELSTLDCGYDIQISGDGSQVVCSPKDPLVSNDTNEVRDVYTYDVEENGGSSCQSLVEYQIPTAAAGAWDITAGPDGNLWFTESAKNKIGKITPSGVMTEYDIPTADSEPMRITAGPDGNVWFTEQRGNKIGRITPAGVITEYPTSIGPLAITTGPDGNIWFTGGSNPPKVVKLSMGGVFTEYSYPMPGGYTQIALWDIATGPDGNLWINNSFGEIAKVTPAGVFTIYPLPGGVYGGFGITAGPDGNVWFTRGAGAEKKVGKITPGGAMTEYVMPSGGAPNGITVGPDGNLWFTASQRIVSITTTGVFTQYPFNTVVMPRGIVTGPDGNLWFTEHSRGGNEPNNIGKLDPSCPWTGGSGGGSETETWERASVKNDGSQGICEEEAECPSGEQCDEGQGGVLCNGGTVTTTGNVCGSGTPLGRCYICEAECGNDIVEGDEECDDGNIQNADGCSSTCEEEPSQCNGYECELGANQVCAAEDPPTGCHNLTQQPCFSCQGLCGNHELDDGEQCDDGNTRDGDGCDHVCKIEDIFCENESAFVACASPAVCPIAETSPGSGQCAQIIDLCGFNEPEERPTGVTCGIPGNADCTEECVRCVPYGTP